jgi:hypothetical protein
MEPIILFRYHDCGDIVKGRVSLLRRLNPGVAIHGIFGGRTWNPETGRLFDTSYCLKLDGFSAWKNLDLAVLEWYLNLGRELKYTHAYVVEWDLVFVRGLTSVMPVPAPGESLLTGLTEVTEIADRWFWTTERNRRSAIYWRVLKRFAQEGYSFTGPYHACLGPATVLSRQFFEAYERLALPPWCHDELRLPLIHALGGLAVDDNGLYPRSWFSAESSERDRYFNTVRREVTPDCLYEAASQGCAAFHPVYQHLDEARCVQASLSSGEFRS